jgi:hypothetical protein
VNTITPSQVKGIEALIASMPASERDALAKRLQAATVHPLPDPRRGQ